VQLASKSSSCTPATRRDQSLPTSLPT
jgi:hypothetical protein